jgi:cellulase (glycosyl hydrolase family 5)
MTRLRLRAVCVVVHLITSWSVLAQQPVSAEFGWVRVSDDGTHFVRGSAAQRFVVWGVNYDRDRDGRLLEDYWENEWQTVAADFREIKELGANTVRVHLQLGKFMEAVERPNAASLTRLADLVRLAEQTGLYLNITGLGCYHKRDVPPWYDALAEAERWKVQGSFWQAVAKVCRASPAIFCYDLMNEPVVPGAKPETDWLAAEFFGKHYVQRIALDLAGRKQTEVARSWAAELTSAIRQVDERHLITVGVIPWAYEFKNAKPLFYSPEAGGPLNFVSVHFYPKSNDIPAALTALRVYEVGKPLVVEEFFPLRCSIDEAAQFIDGSRSHADGWISFYWGETLAENRHGKQIQHAIMAQWLEYFQSQSKQLATQQNASNK